LALKFDGSIVTWGENDFGQCNVPAPNIRFVAVAAGTIHSAALRNSSPIALQSFDSYWENGHVTVAWLLADIVGEVTFDVRRREATSEPYHPLQDVDIQQRANEFLFQDETTRPGMTYQYRVFVYEDGAGVASFESAITTPATFLLGQNHPNPFNPVTRIEYAVQRAGPVMLAIYDPSGRLVTTLVNKPMQPGTYNAEWDGRDPSGHRMASGVYFYRLSAGDEVLSRKMVLLK
jgi:hypothetical protein